MIEHLFNTTVDKIECTYNLYGDAVYSNTFSTIDCRFQEHIGMQYQNNVELADTDAICWFSPDVEMKAGDILKQGSNFYRIKKVVHGIGFGEEEFVKCFLEAHHPIAGV